jgi:hypothetical protein
MNRFRLALLVAATLAATSCGDAVNGPDRAQPTRLRLTVILPQPGVAALQVALPPGVREITAAPGLELHGATQPEGGPVVFLAEQALPAGRVVLAELLADGCAARVAAAATEDFLLVPDVAGFWLACEPF